MRAQLLKKLPNSRRHPPGLEWKVLRKLPWVFAGGTLIPIMVSLGLRVWTPAPLSASSAALLANVDILMTALVLTVWMTLVPVALLCLTIWLMKGPGYVADAYHLEDSDAPAPKRSAWARRP